MADPALLEKVLPGFQLVRRPMTPEERAATSLPNANAARLALHSAWVLDVYSRIKRWRADDPAISMTRIVAKLKHLDITPPRSGNWSTRAVNAVIEQGARLEPPEN